MSIEFSISESINLLPKRINSVYKIEGWFSRSNAWIIFDKVRYLNGVGFVSNTSILDKKQPISISSPSFDKIKEVAIFIKELLQK